MPHRSRTPPPPPSRAGTSSSSSTASGSSTSTSTTAAVARGGRSGTNTRVPRRGRAPSRRTWRARRRSRRSTSTARSGARRRARGRTRSSPGTSAYELPDALLHEVSRLTVRVEDWRGHGADRHLGLSAAARGGAAAPAAAARDPGREALVAAGAESLPADRRAARRRRICGAGADALRAAEGRGARQLRVPRRRAGLHRRHPVSAGGRDVRGDADVLRRDAEARLQPDPRGSTTSPTRWGCCSGWRCRARTAPRSRAGRPPRRADADARGRRDASLGVHHQPL